MVGEDASPKKNGEHHASVTARLLDRLMIDPFARHPPKDSISQVIGRGPIFRTAGGLVQEVINSVEARKE